MGVELTPCGRTTRSRKREGSWEVRALALLRRTEGLTRTAMPGTMRRMNQMAKRQGGQWCYCAFAPSPTSCRLMLTTKLSLSGILFLAICSCSSSGHGCGEGASPALAVAASRAMLTRTLCSQMRTATVQYSTNADMDIPLYSVRLSPAARASRFVSPLLASRPHSTFRCRNL